jgi:uncharacterized membrane protein
MYSHLKSSGRLNESLFLGSLSSICIVFSIYHDVCTGFHAFFPLLNWNLFLAFLPWLFSTILTIYPNLQKNKIKITVFFLLWLVFFPNSIYILTDLYYLESETSMPKWFDLVMFLSYAWVGLMFGLMSLWDIEKIIGQRIGKYLMHIVSFSLLFLGSFGIYLGRYLRWNSWDIIRKPSNLFHEISDRVLNPLENKGVWGMTLLMFIFLSMVYWSFKFIKKRG